MRTITLDDNEWNQVMAILATGAWNQVNPLLMKVGSQLAAQRHAAANPPNVAALDGERPPLAS